MKIKRLNEVKHVDAEVVNPVATTVKQPKVHQTTPKVTNVQDAQFKRIANVLSGKTGDIFDYYTAFRYAIDKAKSTSLANAIAYQAIKSRVKKEYHDDFEATFGDQPELDDKAKRSLRGLSKALDDRLKVTAIKTDLGENIAGQFGKNVITDVNNANIDTFWSRFINALKWQELRNGDNAFLDALNSERFYQEVNSLAEFENVYNYYVRTNKVDNDAYENKQIEQSGQRQLAEFETKLDDFNKELEERNKQSSGQNIELINYEKANSFNDILKDLGLDKGMLEKIVNSVDKLAAVNARTILQYIAASVVMPINNYSEVITMLGNKYISGSLHDTSKKQTR